MIDQIDSTRREKSKSAKNFKPRLLVQKLRLLVQDYWRNDILYLGFHIVFNPDRFIILLISKLKFSSSR
jgi:hypothetical protein